MHAATPDLFPKNLRSRVRIDCDVKCDEAEAGEKGLFIRPGQCMRVRA